jgi:hypothetical protein
MRWQWVNNKEGLSEVLISTTTLQKFCCLLKPQALLQYNLDTWVIAVAGNALIAFTACLIWRSGAF